MIQCALPTQEILGKPSFDFTFVWDKATAPQTGKMDLSMCPNKHAGKEYNMALCTTSQFGTSITREDIVVWTQFFLLFFTNNIFFSYIF